MKYQNWYLFCGWFKIQSLGFVSWGWFLKMPLCTVMKVSYLEVCALTAYTDQWHAVPYKRENMFLCEDNLMTLIIHNLKWVILFEENNDPILKYILPKNILQRLSLSSKQDLKMQSVIHFLSAVVYHHISDPCTRNI